MFWRHKPTLAFCQQVVRNVDLKFAQNEMKSVRKLNVRDKRSNFFFVSNVSTIPLMHARFYSNFSVPSLPPSWGAGLAQWWQRSPPTNVSRVRFPGHISVIYVGWVCCWFSTLLREVFLRVLRFSPLLKNQHFQISILFRNARPLSNEFFEHLVLCG